MRYTRLILKNYKRFRLNQINEIDYTPLSPYQVITGNNGSGKTSLLDELTPLPPDKKKFLSGGYKEIHIEKDGKQYVLVSDFTQSSNGTHSFKENDFELNDSLNVTMQRQLVETYFGYTPEIHRFIMGEVKLTDMTAIERRDWFVKIANTDMEFIMSLFGKVKMHARDGQGAIRTGEKRLVEESKKLDALQASSGLVEERNELDNAIRRIDQELPRAFEKIEDLERAMVRLFKDVERDILAEQDFLKQHGVLSQHWATEEALRSKFQQAMFNQVSLEQQYQDTLRDFQSTEEEVGKMVFDDGLSDEDIQRELLSLQIVLDTNRTLLDFEGDAKLAFDKLVAIQQSLIDWCTNSPKNPEGRFNREKMDKAQSDLETLNRQHASLSGNLEYLNNNIKSMENFKINVTCPTCSTNWDELPEKSRLQEFQQKRKEISEKLPQLEVQINKRRDYINECVVIRDNLSHYRRHFVQAYPELRYLWFKIAERGDSFLHDPSSVITLISLLPEQLRQHDAHQQAEKRYRFLVDILNARNNSQTAQLKGKLSLLSSQLDKYQSEIKVEKANRERYESDLDYATRCQGLARSTEYSINNYLMAVEELEGSILWELLTQRRSELLSKLAQVTEKLNALEVQTKLLEQLGQHIDDLRRQDEAYKRLIHILNPNDGLIAKSLHGFIVHFLKQMNQLIGHIWTYDLNVIVDNESDFTSKYRFPVNVGNNIDTEDVSKTSLGQKDILNFAFMMLVLRYLKMSHVPLLLDELGRTFTEAHRFRIFNYLKQLVETGQVEQLFLVSHNATSHESFHLADFISMDVNGVVTSDKVNKNITFK